MLNEWCFRILLLLLSSGIHCLLVIDPPEVIVTEYLQSSPALLQTNIRFACFEVPPNSTTLSCPRRDVIWLKDGMVLDSASSKYKFEAVKRQLELQNISATDMGVYECAYHLKSTNKGSAMLWIAPYIVYAPLKQLVQPSGDQVVECTASGGIRSVRWTKDGQRVAVSNGTLVQAFSSRYDIFPNGSLHITAVEASDTGLYGCLVYNKAGNDSATIELTNEAIGTTEHCVSIGDYRFGPGPVISIAPKPTSPPLLPAPPTIQTTSPRCVRSIEGYSVILNCTTSGLPYPTTCWKKDSTTITNATTTQTGGAHFRQLDDGSLMISTLQPGDHGNYTCHASSGMGSTNQTITLLVQAAGKLCGFSGNNTVNGFSGAAGVRKKRIYDGQVVSVPNQWPWQVILEFPMLQTSEESLCGGALIRPDWVLTAAHCVLNLKPSDILLRAGVFNRSSQEVTQQVLAIKAIYLHPKAQLYSITNRMFDIALIKLEPPAQLTPSVGLVCLPAGPPQPPVKTLCTVAGWGHQSDSSTVSPDLLREATVPLVSSSQCSSAYKPRPLTNQLCAGYAAGGPDACQNDSGGPLVCKQGTRWTQYGIVASGDGCGKPNKYGVYTDVTKFTEWINTTCATNI